jgi:DNA-binding transcriptional LysR family regulator
MEASMDVQALRCFVEVARHQNFTRAGQALHLSQPAVSKTVKALEERLGTTLLLRERRRVLLTDAGRLVLDRAQGVLDALRGLEVEVQEFAGLKRGRLRLGLPPMAALALAPLLSEFRRAHPAIRLELREGGSRAIEALVRDRDIDVGAVVLPTDQATFEIHPFVHDRLRVVVHPDHPLARRRQVAVRDLAGSPLVLYHPEFALHGHILDACRRGGIEPEVVGESAHWDLIVALVASDLGVAFLPETICRRLDRRQVRHLPLAGEPIPWDVALVWRRDRHLPPATRAFLGLAERRLPRHGASGPRP